MVGGIWPPEKCGEREPHTSENFWSTKAQHVDEFIRIFLTNGAEV